MADDETVKSRRPVPVTLAVIAALGWLLAAYLWAHASRTQTEMAESLRAAQRARESLAADLQDLQKAAGTAAEVKK